MSQSYPETGNYGRGNLEMGSKGSLGTEEHAQVESQSVDNEPTESRADVEDVVRTVGDETGTVGLSHFNTGIQSPPIDFEGPDQDAAAEMADTPDQHAVDESKTEGAGGLGTIGTEVSTTADLELKSTADLRADELGSLENFEDDLTGSEIEASDMSESDIVAGTVDEDEAESLADIGHEPSDNTSAAAQDAGMRIVDESDAEFGEAGDASPVAAGADAGDFEPGTDDARPLSDFTQESSGFASESDEPSATAGDRSDHPFGSATGMDTTETGLDADFSGELESTGALETTDTDQMTDAAQGSETEVTVSDALDSDDETSQEWAGLFGTRDIDTTDLGYLDEAENVRYDFAPREERASGNGSVVDGTDGAGVADDIAASPTGVLGDEGAVSSSGLAQPEPDAIEPSESESGVAGDSSTMIDEVGASPTGLQDEAGVVESDVTEAEESEIVASTGSTTPADNSGMATTAAVASAPGGRIRGDDTGSCPINYPIKGNGSSKIYHVPGIPSYRGTKAEWCFATEDDAIAAGFRAPGQRNQAGKSSAGSARSEATAAPAETTSAASAPAPLDDVLDNQSEHLVEAAPSDGTLVVPDLENAPFGTTDSSEATGVFGTIPEPNFLVEEGGFAGDEHWGEPADSTGGIETDSGADDVESLESPSPDSPAAINGDDGSVGETDVQSALRGQQAVDSEILPTPDVAGSGIAGAESESETVDTGVEAEPMPADEPVDDGFAGAIRGDGTRQCPGEYPIKGNAGSMIYHEPGRASYDATIPEWCFARPEDAVNAGFRAPKR